MATSGPGATNLVTGIATAYMDSSPIVAITCNVATSLLGKDSFQEIDICGVTMPITKHNFMVKKIDDLADTIRAAFLIAKSGRPGPVLIDIPKEVTDPKNLIDFKPLKKLDDSKKLLEKFAPNLKRVFNVAKPSESEIKSAAKLINSSKQPVIYAGGGVMISNATKELFEFATKANIPVSESLMARAAFPSSNPLCAWMVGMHGTKASNMAVTECDLLITLGARFSDRVLSDASKFAKGAKILHIDIDPAEIGKNVNADLHLVGDLKAVLSRLLPLVEEKPRKEWLKKIAA